MRVIRGKIAISGISSSLNYCVMFIAVPHTIYKRGRGLRVEDSDHQPSALKGSAKAREPSRRRLSMETRFRSQASIQEICAVQSGTGTCF